jgi:hypothetical protein
VRPWGVHRLLARAAHPTPLDWAFPAWPFATSPPGALPFLNQLTSPPPLPLLPAHPTWPTQLDKLNQWINILQSVQLPFAVIPVSARRACCSLRPAPWARAAVTPMLCFTVPACHAGVLLPRCAARPLSCRGRSEPSDQESLACRAAAAAADVRQGGDGGGLCEQAQHHRWACGMEEGVVMSGLCFPCHLNVRPDSACPKPHHRQSASAMPVSVCKRRRRPRCHPPSSCPCP